MEQQLKSLEKGVEKEIDIVEGKLMDEMKAREALEEELIQADNFIEELKGENE